MSEFLQECYVAAGRADAASRALLRLRAMAADSTADGQPVSLIRSILLPGEETWFLLWEAESAETIRAVAGRAGVPCDRITAALALPAVIRPKD